MANVTQSTDATLIVGSLSLKVIGYQYNNDTSAFREENRSTRVFCVCGILKWRTGDEETENFVWNKRIRVDPGGLKWRKGCWNLFLVDLAFQQLMSSVIVASPKESVDRPTYQAATGCG